ncbi:hypothetical protein NQZ68_001066 [Dissostichus eleginoides]|nr:hypothetical protein NQZ68_001066 [Dissostichus eleginoides]
MLTKSCSTILIILNLILNLPLIEQTSQQGRRFIHVSDRMTWSSAQEYCREHHTDLATIRDQNDIDAIRDTYLNHVYDLAHMDFDGDNLLAKKKVQDSETAEVWIGLRFLAGRWLWVNGTPLQEQLNVCPGPKRRCGTMSKMGELHPLRDCLERRNFFCSLK